MIRSIRQPLLFAAGLFVLPLAHADDAPPPPVGWTGQGRGRCGPGTWQCRHDDGRCEV